MAKKRSRGGYRQPSKPAAVSGPGALSARTDGGPGSAKQPVQRIPGVDYGEQKALTEQQQAAPLPKATMPQAQPSVARPMPQMDIFAETQRPSEPVTAGLPFGPGINPQPQQQVLKAEEVRDFIYNSWLETGDDSLLEYI